MKLIVDTDLRTITRHSASGPETTDLYAAEAFEWLSEQWLKVGWACGYYQSFTWLGCPIIQLPDDVLRIQAVIDRVRPSVIVETGVAFGGSLLFYASLLTLTAGRKVIGVDLRIDETVRTVIERHSLAQFITLVEGNSVDPAVAETVASHIVPTDRVMVVLDSCHTKAHVLAELELYHRFVSDGSYIIPADGIMRDLFDVPGGQPAWQSDNPGAAAIEFASRHQEFVIEQPASGLRAFKKPLTYWPDAWLCRKSSTDRGSVR